MLHGMKSVEMSELGPTSWASVVANGLIDEPVQLGSNNIEILSMPPPSPMLPKTETPSTVPSFSSSSALSTILTSASTIAPATNFEKLATPASKSSLPEAAYCLTNHLHSYTDIERSTPFNDHYRCYHSSNSPWSICQTSHQNQNNHHYEFGQLATCPYSSLEQMQLHFPAPLNWQPMMKPLLVQPDDLQVSNRYPSMHMFSSPLSPVEKKMSSSAIQPQDLMYGWDQQQCRMTDIGDVDITLEQQSYQALDLDDLSEMWPNTIDSSHQNLYATTCTQARIQHNLTQWQPIGNTRQIWEPLNMNKRDQDPSNPSPPPPPGFEHVVPGKRSLSSRARMLMGEQVMIGIHMDYPTPEPMVMPERELREQQHFIAKHDTHLTCRLAQLQVTNGAIADGYYVRPVPKLVLKNAKILGTPKYQSLFHPDVSYWELLRRNQDKVELETT